MKDAANFKIGLILIVLTVVALCSFRGATLQTLDNYQADSLKCTNTARFEGEAFLVSTDSTVNKYLFDFCREEWYLVATKINN